MTITLYGHTLPIDDLTQGERIQAFADQLDADGKDDELQQWLYAGAPPICTDRGAKLDRKIKGFGCKYCGTRGEHYCPNDVARD